nr:uncharacterized protein LOC128704709 [Cherax quadricarinatus]
MGVERRRRGTRNWMWCWVVICLILGGVTASPVGDILETPTTTPAIVPSTTDPSTNSPSTTDPSATTTSSIQPKRDKRGYGFTGGIGHSLLQQLASQSGGVGGLQFLLGGHQGGHHGHSAADLASRAAGKATAAAESQAEAAYKAAQEASRKVAAKASSAAQEAQAAAAAKYAEAAQLTQAAQLAQAIVFKEAAQTAQTKRTVQAADNIQLLALSQVAILQQALGAAEAQAAVAQQVLASATDAYYQQSNMLSQAQAVANKIIQKQTLAVSDLARTQGAAEQAQAAATKALYTAHPARGTSSVYGKH